MQNKQSCFFSFKPAFPRRLKAARAKVFAGVIGKMQCQQGFQQLSYKAAPVSDTGRHPYNPYSFWLSAVLYKKEKSEKKFCRNQKPYIFVAH
ncbi:MAG TPA: hypothetical protein PK678_00760 [Ferruginibacter sp.]|nr:hypothetical protein [Ferruginibacter sp.]